MLSLTQRYLTDRFLNLYGVPDAVDPKAFVAEYDKALGGTEESLLKAAADQIVRDHKFRNWPTVGDCVAMVRTVATQRAMAKARSAPPEYARTVTHSAESRARVNALVKQALHAMRSQAAEAPKPVFDRWDQTTKPAWEERMRTSPRARWLSISQELRELITGQKQ